MNNFIYSIEDEFVYEELRKSFDREDLVLFAGAGVSAQARTLDGRHPPCWQSLLEGMIEWCFSKRIIDSQYKSELQQLIDNQYFTDAGEELEDLLNNNSSLQRCLSDVLLYNEARSADIHKLLVKLPFRAFITVNYDDFIEGEYLVQNSVHLSKYHEKTRKEALEDFRSHRPFIFKMHGDISDPSSIILGNRSYNRLLYSDNAHQHYFISMFAVTSILFLGFGGYDPDLEAILGKASLFDSGSKRHWMVVEEGRFPLLKIKQLSQKKGINIVQYKSDETHSGLLKFIKKLSESPAPLKVSYDATSIFQGERI